MCQMSVVLEQDGKEQLIMENVTMLEAVSGGITVSALFEEPESVPDTIVKKIDFMDGKVILTSSNKGEANESEN
jgi:predicted RNA-binding protein